MHMASSNVMQRTNTKLRISPESSVSVVPTIGRLLLTFQVRVKAGEEFKDTALLCVIWGFLLLKSRSSLPPWKSDVEVGEDRDRQPKLIYLTFGSYPFTSQVSDSLTLQTTLVQLNTLYRASPGALSSDSIIHREVAVSVFRVPLLCMGCRTTN